MSLIVALTLFCVANAPTLAASMARVDPASSNLTSVLVLNPIASTKQRSTWEILWTCLATIFACTWVSIHPNIPSSKDGRIRIALQRLELMVWAILTPEMIIFWAMRQWRHARALTKLYEGYYGWTITHSHFLLMGGFVLSEGPGAHDTTVLTPKDFRNLLAEKEIGFPLISEKEIQDRSKGDGLSKALATIQTTWFIAQCISRKAQGLTITEIELVTVAFAFLNGIMYFLWWSKPVGVTTSVRIYRLTSPIPLPPTISITRDREPTFTTSTLVFESPTGMQATDMILSMYGVTGIETGSSDQISLASSMTIPQITTPPMVHHDRPPSESDSIHLDPKSEPVSQLTPPSCNRESGWHISRHLLRTFLFIFNRVNEMRGELKTHSWTEPTRIPTFFPFEDDPLVNQAYHIDHCRVAIISLLFGLIHCLGWSFVFPSGAERLIWRVSAAIIAALPVLILSSYSVILFFRFTYEKWFLIEGADLGSSYFSPEGLRRLNLLTLYANWIVKPMNRFRKAMWWIFLILIPIYLLARMALLVEAFLSLRSLPSGAYLVVNWTAYLPHI